MNFKKVLSVFLSLILVFSLCAPAVSAAIADHEHKEVVNYVSLGDSMTNGYGIEGYNQSTPYGDLSKVEYGKDSYAIAFENYLKSIYGEKNVNHTKLALSGMLSYDLLYLLGGLDKPVADTWFGYLDYCGFDHHSEWDEEYYVGTGKNPYFGTGI